MGVQRRFSGRKGETCAIYYLNSSEEIDGVEEDFVKRWSEKIAAMAVQQRFRV